MFNESEQKVIEKVLGQLDKFGTDRVITHSDGSKVPFKNAIHEFKVPVELLFIRHAGYTLGCSRMHETIAYNASETWIAVIIKPEAEPRSIDNYLGLTNNDKRNILPPLPMNRMQKTIKKAKG